MPESRVSQQGFQIVVRRSLLVTLTVSGFNVIADQCKLYTHHTHTKIIKEKKLEGTIRKKHWF